MVEPLGWLALGLLVLAVAGAFLPLLPGALLSLTGILLYWFSTGYTDPSTAVVVVLSLVALGTAAVDYFGGALAARAGGASTLSTLLASVVGVVLLFVTGPVGLILGVAGTVFAAEYWRNRDATESAQATLYAVVGILASTVAQVLVTLSLLVAMLVVAFG
ncbi:DUF456 domain-containing protein [Halomarina oriensis]|uniref:DUF456 family protein n=1 Tax=Halomarina oriensis TaxID=671145 RepID=A0A6B0GEE7_9EURY|nr:DUF456 domain-containing protein [Halomarina oriensis]MWG33084.1 DUF456 family protein [Halomarina oriensis]